MKRILLSAAVLAALTSFGQTLEYETGNGTTDGWTGWSTPVVSNASAGSINGVNHYQFSGTASDVYSIETYRQFNINSNDIDIRLDVLTQDATIAIEHSTDNVTYNQIGTLTAGTGYAISSLIIPTVDPQTSSFYLKIKVNGTFGSPSSTNLYYMKIDAVLNSSGIDDLALGTNVFYFDNQIQINTSAVNYNVNLFNLEGKEVYNGSSVSTVDMNGLEDGLYLLRVTDLEGHSKTLKISHTK